ncbi:hypothetical protein ASPWEDRAFT_32670 [Aspergillus wentii DTO 134E9]|uniref:Uncharacterized protein n=1 Tax=Aspergillus wentii DTO 134E9 TaxID=1073089 RepID=A0A1L9R6E7_ASPWE|nr:uncharacterized protein ASPWEDRAFT_32670 [Aspergillus wentii DTO 134E9]KAI9926834.1 hypothetical protein MW887_003931 [Aspergillus wentii]OJJ30495.1 hypothetical protein ASPWEDRAFT_32670 [Aspergillus wentii DTO 134E9]
MPSPLTTPVLTVDTEKIHKVDTANAQSLHGMWMVFSKCADYMEEGRRLENLSWRLWTRETFCVEPETTSEASAIPLLRSEGGDLPELSASVESAASDQAERIEHHIKRPRADYRPAVVREDSLVNLSRGKEKHITSLGLERMVLNIKEKKNLEPLPAPMTTVSPPVVDITPRPSTPTPTPPSVSTTKPTPSFSAFEDQQMHQSTESCSTTAPEGNDSDAAQTAASDTSVSSSGILPSRPGLVKSPSIVRGFSPAMVSSSYRSQPRLAVEPGPAHSPARLRPSPLKKKGGMFTLGGSSGDDDESSFEDRMAIQGRHRSSLSDELKPNTSNPSPNKKVASFRDDVGIIKDDRDNDEDAIETEDEVSESAIDDDEDSDWEDSVTESGRSSVEENAMFQRVDSRPNLVSRRSMLTMMMHQPARMQGNNSRSTPALQRSRLTSPNGPAVAASPPDHDEDNLTMRGPDVPRSKPIIVRAPPQSVAHSPRTTRRNMLATELTESLRRHLLWERQQKSATANAFLKRRHTAHDMANLKEYPNPSGQSGSSATDAKNSSFTNYTDFGPWEYHVKGW